MRDVRAETVFLLGKAIYVPWKRRSQLNDIIAVSADRHPDLWSRQKLIDDSDIFTEPVVIRSLGHLLVAINIDFDPIETAPLCI